VSAPAPMGAVRPHIPPVAWLAAFVWAGSSTASVAVWWCRASGRPPEFAWIAVGFVAVCSLACVKRHRRLAAILLALTVGVATATAHGCWMLGQGATAEAAGPGDWTGTVVADPKDGLGGTRVTVALRDGVAGGRFALDWPTGAPIPEYGRRVTFSARLRAPVASDTYSQRAFLGGEAGSGKPWRVAVVGWDAGVLGVAAALRDRCLDVLDAAGVPGAAVVASAVFGRRNTRDEERFRVVGAAHLLTASGIHLALAAAMAGVSPGSWEPVGRGPSWSQPPQRLDSASWVGFACR
jgi:predicted membrane metal-binding protein